MTLAEIRAEADTMLRGHNIFVKRDAEVILALVGIVEALLGHTTETKHLGVRAAMAKLEAL